VSCVKSRRGRGRSDVDYGTPPALTGARDEARTTETPTAPDVAAEELDDLTLVVRAQEGDTHSFEALVRRHQRHLYRLAVRLLANSNDAEEAVQDAFLAAWRQLRGFRGETAFSSWIYQIVTNRCLTLLHKLPRVTSLDGLECQPDPGGASPEHAIEADQCAVALNRVLQDLPTDQRTCWVLRELHGLSYEDIAAIVDASPDAVQGWLYRARRSLVEAMTPWVNGAPPQHDAGLLACGRDAAKVWDRAAAGRFDTHDRSCPHCQAVAEDERLQATAIATLADEAVEPPPSLLEQVMEAVLSELRPAEYLPLPTRHGHARIDRIAAAGILRHAVDQMSALRVRSCQIHLIGPSGTDDTSGGVLAVSSPTGRVHISVAAWFGTDLLSATARVRQMIFTAAEDLLGLSVTTVDVDVVDVFDDPRRRAH
jgi:RNA polymerase sigma-70 factor, ECF subfamily